MRKHDPILIPVRDGFGLPAEFWKHFREHHWQKCPLLLRQPFGAPLANSADVFQGIVKASEQFGGDAVHGPLGFFINYALLQADIEKYLPNVTDGTLRGFAARVKEMLKGRVFALVASRYPAFDAQSWLRLRDFLRPLYELIGVPANPTQVVLFLGDYDKTPFGVHQDPHETFVFVVEGRKRFLTWPSHFFGKDHKVMRTLNYEPFREGAIVLEGGPGDILYWPSSYWHVAESVGGFTASMSVALFMNSQPSIEISEYVLGKVAEYLVELDRACPSLFYPDHLQESADKLPRIVKRVAAALRAVGEDPQLQGTMRVEQLNRLTSFGFSVVPPPLSHKRLEDKHLVRGNRRYPIVWLTAANDEIVFSANGHSFSVVAHPNVLDMVKKLNDGEACRVKDLIGEYAGRVRVYDVEFEASPKDIRAFLEKLYSLRAIALKSQQSAKRNLKP